MFHTLLKTGAVLALGTIALAGPALAATLLPYNGAQPPVILVQDEENKELWQDLRPDVTPPPAAVGKEEAPKGAAEPPMEEGSGDVENEEVLRDLRTEEAPPAEE